MIVSKKSDTYYHTNDNRDQTRKRAMNRDSNTDRRAHQVRAPMLIKMITRSRMTLDRPRSSDLHKCLKIVMVMMISHSVLTVAARGIN